MGSMFKCFDEDHGGSIGRWAHTTPKQDMGIRHQLNGRLGDEEWYSVCINNCITWSNARVAELICQFGLVESAPHTCGGL
jgi:hypothetical protein